MLPSGLIGALNCGVELNIIAAIIEAHVIERILTHAGLTARAHPRRYQAARLLCLRGRLAELDGGVAEAESAYRRAIEIAEQQGALLHSPRAATLLTRLYRSQGRAAEADAALRPIYDRFTEGFDYPGLIRARSVLVSRG